MFAFFGGGKETLPQEDNLVFISDPPILSSVLIEKRIRFALKWKQWKPRIVTVDKNGILEYRKPMHTVTAELNLKKAYVSYLPNDVLLATLTPDKINKYTGITLKCSTLDGFDTYFRCILENQQFHQLKAAIKLTSQDHNIASLGPIYRFSDEEIAKKGKQKTVARSVMRRTIAQAMNNYDIKSRRDQIIARRGALKFLPVCFDNDLIHGSW